MVINRTVGIAGTCEVV